MLDFTLVEYILVSFSAVSKNYHASPNLLHVRALGLITFLYSLETVAGVVCNGHKT